MSNRSPDDQINTAARELLIRALAHTADRLDKLLSLNASIRKALSEGEEVLNKDVYAYSRSMELLSGPLNCVITCTYFLAKALDIDVKKEVSSPCRNLDLKPQLN